MSQSRSCASRRRSIASRVMRGPRFECRIIADCRVQRTSGPDRTREILRTVRCPLKPDEAPVSGPRHLSCTWGKGQRFCCRGRRINQPKEWHLRERFPRFVVVLGLALIPLWGPPPAPPRAIPGPSAGSRRTRKRVTRSSPAGPTSVRPGCSLPSSQLGPRRSDRGPCFWTRRRSRADAAASNRVRHGYEVRRKIHVYASFAMIPLFVTQRIWAQSCQRPTDGVRSAQSGRLDDCRTVRREHGDGTLEPERGLEESRAPQASPHARAADARSRRRVPCDGPHRARKATATSRRTVPWPSPRSRQRRPVTS